MKIEIDLGSAKLTELIPEPEVFWKKVAHWLKADNHTLCGLYKPFPRPAPKNHPKCPLCKALLQRN